MLHLANSQLRLHPAQMASRWRSSGKTMGRYAIAIAIVLASALFRAAFLDPLGLALPFLTFFPAVAFSALLGGGGPGLVATALSAALVDYYWIAPVHTFAVATLGDRIGLSVFITSGFIVSFTAERLKRATEDIERRVVERTQQLEHSMRALNHEVTERAKLEEHFRRVVESLPNAMVMSDEQGRIVLVNKEAERAFGYSREEMHLQPIEMLLPQSERSRHAQHRRSFIRAPAERLMGVGRDLFGARKDGTFFPVEIGLGPLVSSEGVKVIASIADISKRKEMEHALGASEEQMRLIFDSIRDHAILMLDPDGTVVSWNAGAERLKGYLKEDIVGRNYEVFFLPEDVAEGMPKRQLEIAARDGHVELRASVDGRTDPNLPPAWL